MTIYYDSRQSVDDVNSFSPSASKPARFVKLMQHYRFHDYGPHALGPVIPVTREDLYRVHAKLYVDEVFSGVQNNGFETRDPRVPESCLWTIGSLLAAARGALKNPALPACSPTSGFHHAGHNYGGGYCTFNGLATVAARLVSEHPGIKIAILDCDFHYGDGTDDILDRNQPLSTNVAHFTSGKHFHGDDDPEQFFLWLGKTIAKINHLKCDLVLYQAGADMHIKDPLGGLLDDSQMLQRDRMVFRKIRSPIAWNLAGGYREGDAVLQTHRSTLYEASDSYKTRLEFFTVPI